MSQSPRRPQYALLGGLFLFTSVALVPLVWGVLTSLKHPADAFSIPPKLIFTPTLEYHVAIWTDYDFPKFLLNSLIVAFGTIVISVPVSTLAAYGLSRMPASRSSSILLGLFAIRMFPHLLLAIPSRRHSAAIDSSPRKTSSTMRIFSSAEYCLRVARRMSLMTCSAGAFPVPDFCLIFAPLKGYDELEILRSLLSRFGPISAEAGQPAFVKQPETPPSGGPKSGIGSQWAGL
jgi:hypothetical protein